MSEIEYVVVEKSFPGHRGRPGERGGSEPRDGRERLMANGGERIKQMLLLLGDKVDRDTLWRSRGLDGTQPRILTDGKIVGVSDDRVSLAVEDTTVEPWPGESVYVDGEDAEAVAKGDLEPDKVKITSGKRTEDWLRGVMNIRRRSPVAAGEIDTEKVSGMVKKYRKDDSVSHIVLEINEDGEIVALPGLMPRAGKTAKVRRDEAVRVGRMEGKLEQRQTWVAEKDRAGALFGFFPQGKVKIWGALGTKALAGRMLGIELQQEQDGKRYRGVGEALLRDVSDQ